MALDQESTGRGRPRTGLTGAVAERFAENLNRLRREAGLTQEELAWRAALHRTQISLMEGGDRLPRFETLVKLIGALDVPSDGLLDGIRWEPVVRRPGGFHVGHRGEDADAAEVESNAS